jgi:magnesium transporter
MTLSLLGLGIAPLFGIDETQKVIVVPITLVSVVICGTVFGSVLPLIFKRLGLDPAMMSIPVVAGIMDIMGIMIYMNVALLLLG